MSSNEKQTTNLSLVPNNNETEEEKFDRLLRVRVEAYIAEAGVGDLLTIEDIVNDPDDETNQRLRDVLQRELEAEKQKKRERKAELVRQAKKKLAKKVKGDIDEQARKDLHRRLVRDREIADEQARVLQLMKEEFEGKVPECTFISLQYAAVVRAILCEGAKRTQQADDTNSNDILSGFIKDVERVLSGAYGFSAGGNDFNKPKFSDWLKKDGKASYGFFDRVRELVLSFEPLLGYAPYLKKIPRQTPSRRQDEPSSSSYCPPNKVICPQCEQMMKFVVSYKLDDEGRLVETSNKPINAFSMGDFELGFGQEGWKLACYNCISQLKESDGSDKLECACNTKSRHLYFWRVEKDGKFVDGGTSVDTVEDADSLRDNGWDVGCATCKKRIKATADKTVREKAAADKAAADRQRTRATKGKSDKIDAKSKKPTSKNTITSKGKAPKRTRKGK